MTITTSRIIVRLGLLAVFGLQACRSESIPSDLSEVKLGQHSFAIPKNYQLEKSIPEWLRWLPGIDDGSRDVLLKFSAAEVAKYVPDYRETDGHYREDIVAVLAALDTEETRRYESGERLSDLWHFSGSYTDAIVEPHENAGWHKVYRKVEYPFSWAVLKQLPDTGQKMPNPSDFWISQCLSGDSPLTPSRKRVACKSHVFFDDLVVDFEVSEQNLKVIDGVADYLKAKVTEWKRLRNPVDAGTRERGARVN